jgi:aldose 1-epimerase
MPELCARMPDGAGIEAIELRGCGPWARILTLGAIVQDLRRDGVTFPLVIESPNPLACLGPFTHARAVVGRFANRIGGARFDLNAEKPRPGQVWQQVTRHSFHASTHEGGLS